MATNGQMPTLAQFASQLDRYFENEKSKDLQRLHREHEAKKKRFIESPFTKTLMATLGALNPEALQPLDLSSTKDASPPPKTEIKINGFHQYYQGENDSVSTVQNSKKSKSKSKFYPLRMH